MLQIAQFPSGYVQAKGYLIWDERTKEAALIDLGGPNAKLTDFILKNYLLLKFVLITHAHHDHILGLGYIKRDFPSAKIVCHEDDSALWARAEQGLAETYYLREIPIYFPKDFVSAPDEWFTNGAEFPIGKIIIRTMHTPGHTPGSTCYYCESQKIAFIGDTFNKNGIGYMCFFGHCWEQLEESVYRMKKTFDNSWTLYPAHSDCICIDSVLNLVCVYIKNRK